MRDPRRPILMLSPKTRSQVGSATRVWGMGGCFWVCHHSTKCLVPERAMPSSSVVRKMPTPSALLAVAAATIAATPDFMSAAPRPIRWPFSSVGWKGSCRHWDRSPTGTTSTWPANNRRRVSPRMARRLSTPSAGRCVRVNPASVRRGAMSSRQPADFGVSEGRAMSWRSSSMASISLWLSFVVVRRRRWRFLLGDR